MDHERKRRETLAASHGGRVEGDCCSAGDGRRDTFAAQRTDLHGDFALNSVAKSSADELLHECVERLQNRVENFRARGEQAIPIDDLLALIASLQIHPKEPS